MYRICATRKRDGEVQTFPALISEEGNVSKRPCKTLEEALCVLRAFRTYNTLWNYQLENMSGDARIQRTFKF